MTVQLDLCTEPAGYSERAYNDTALAPCYSSTGHITGYHVLCPADCLINYYWPRNSTGGPSYARIDRADAQETETPEFQFSIDGVWTSGNFSWGIAYVGIGDPGVGHASLTGARMQVQLWNDDDNSPFGPKVRGMFTNTDGTTFYTSIFRLADTGRVHDTWGIDDTVRAYIENGVGYVELGSGAVRSVALSGSFAGTYSRWESHHGGGGGGNSNQGGVGEGGQTARGTIHTLRVAGAQGGWRVGYHQIGLA